MMEDILEASAKEPKTISWHFRHVYFIDRMTEEEIKDMSEKSDGKIHLPAPNHYTSSIPEHLHMMNHVYRSVNHSKGKLLHLLIIFNIFQEWTTQSLSLTQRRLLLFSTIILLLLWRALGPRMK